MFGLLSTVSIVAGSRAYLAESDAQRRRIQAEGLIDYLLSDLAAELRPVGRLALMDGIAKRALDHLSGLTSRDLGPDAKLQRVQALRTMGEILLERGDTQAAATAFDQASAILKALLTEHADQPRLLAEAGTLAYWHGSLAFHARDLVRAQVDFERYLAFSEHLQALQPEVPDWRLEQSYALNNLGSVARARGDVERAIADFGQSVDIKRSMARERPRDNTLSADLADSLSWLGSALDAGGKLAEAAGYQREQLAVLDDLTQRFPDDAQWRHRLALAKLGTSELALAQGNLHSARTFCEAAHRELLELVNLDPSNRSWRRDLVYGEVQLGYLDMLDNRMQAAPGRLNHARALFAELGSLADPPLEWQRLDALIDLRMADLYLRTGKRARAVVHVDAARRQLTSLLSRSPEDISTSTLLSIADILKGDTYTDRGPALDTWKSAYARSAASAEKSIDRRLLAPWVSAACRMNGCASARAQIDRLLKSGYRHPDFIRLLQQEKEAEP